MLAVGLGPGAPDSELKSIAMENSDNVMKIGSFDQLAGNLQKITKDVCQGNVGQLLLCSVLESDHRVKSAYEPLGPSGRRLFQLVHCRVTPSIKFAGTHFYTWAKRGTVRVKFLIQEHNLMCPTRSPFVESPGIISSTRSHF